MDYNWNIEDYMHEYGINLRRVGRRYVATRGRLQADAATVIKALDRLAAQVPLLRFKEWKPR